MEPTPQPSKEITLLANLLLNQHGDNAWQYAIGKMWQARRNKNKALAKQWSAIIDALKELMKFRASL